MSGKTTLTRKMLLPLGAALAALAFAQPVLADCASVDGRIKAAIKAGDRGQFPALHDELVGKSGCSLAYQKKVSRILAKVSLKAIKKEMGAGGQPNHADLVKAASYAQPWQVMVALADSYYEKKDWAMAFNAYEVALDDMRDEKANPKPPPEAVERRARARAIQARALSPTFIASRTIGGVPSGSSAIKFRTFSVQSVPVPIRFEYDSAVLTAHGISAADEIYNFAVNAGGKGIRLTGHTDPIGSANYNLKLSVARAETVRNYLLSKGYTGFIEVIGKGESEPFQADDPGKYTLEELHSFFRRVEFEAIN